MGQKLSKGKAEKPGVALFVVLIETASVLLDAFTNGWKPSLAGLCLSLLGFFIAIYFSCVKTNISKIKPLALKRLGIQEILLSVLQLTASITHLLTFLLHRKNIFDVSVFIPLGFAIIAFAFSFYEKKNVIDWSSADLSTEAFISRYDYRNSIPEKNDLREIKTVNDSNSTNTLRSRLIPGQRTEIPRIRNLQITGEARPGEKLLGSPEFVNGTSSCTFQWVRASSLLGRRNQRIEGATQQHYVVTVDDVDKLIALECIPVDDLGHQGQLVRAFANENSKIECDMKREIEGRIFNRKAIFDVQLLITSTQQWEPATFIVSWPSYKIKINSTEAVVIRDHMFSEDAFSIETHNGLSTQFILRCLDSTHLLSTNTVRMRDILVLTMREFKRKRSPAELEAFFYGYVFSPTEEEILQLLELKMSSTVLSQFYHIKEIELYRYEPSELSSIAYDSGREIFYFFTPIRYLRRGFVNRKAKGGIWKKKGKAYVIENRDGNRVAKTLLIYHMQHKDKATASVKTSWCMKEYRFFRSQNNERSSWALCVVYLQSPRRENLNL
ncbi:Microtubule-associated protein [Melia azedarach]|uniref:Microtubule-associated protein n=1 Tax=Melia azedarach TaxID=155640 RepID=A0ACC1YCV3_MELAZ|nr:Microtubule-associated protein [Melia azedarach]